MLCFFFFKYQTFECVRRKLDRLIEGKEKQSERKRERKVLFDSFDSIYLEIKFSLALNERKDYDEKKITYKMKNIYKRKKRCLEEAEEEEEKQHVRVTMNEIGISRFSCCNSMSRNPRTRSRSV